MHDIYLSMGIATVMFPPFEVPEYNRVYDYLPLPSLVGSPMSINFGQEYIPEAGMRGPLFAGRCAFLYVENKRLLVCLFCIIYVRSDDSLN
jgi:hypothetical protein